MVSLVGRGNGEALFKDERAMVSFEEGLESSGIMKVWRG